MGKEQIQVTREVLRQMIEAAGVKDATGLAKRAGISHTTLTRILADSAKDDAPDVSWTLSARTWMKLSQASGVPVTFLGENVSVPRLEPGDRYIIKQPIQIRLLQFWDMLSDDQRDLIIGFIDVWAEKIVQRKPTR